MCSSSPPAAEVTRVDIVTGPDTAARWTRIAVRSSFVDVQPIAIRLALPPAAAVFCANVSILYTELPFMERLAAARQPGFDAVECWFPYEHGVDAVARVLRDLDLEMAGINSAHEQRTKTLALVPRCPQLLAVSISSVGGRDRVERAFVLRATS